MQPPYSENRLLLSITLVLALFFTTFYIVYTPPSTKDHVAGTDKLAQQNQVETACDKVDISWLAGDRMYWDGWTDKTMFMRTDGAFTKGNVYIDEGDEICVVVLLGPTPAQSSIKDEDHLGNKDSIALFATGSSTKITIELQAHKTQTNAYFASVKFTQADTYKLDAQDEYRSYFWEAPILHNYRPYRFQSQNHLVVAKSETPPPRLPMCENDTDITGTWVNTTVFKASKGRSMHTMFENNENEFAHNDKVFVPDHCQFKFKSTGEVIACLGTRTVHVWGDNNLRRNLKAIDFNGNQWCNVETISKNIVNSESESACICNDDAQDTTQYPWITDPHVPLELDNSWDVDAKFYYNNVAGSLTTNNHYIFDRMKKYTATTSTTTRADMVIVGLGNDDVQALKVSPNDFAHAFQVMLLNVRHVYPTQPIIVRTPQYFCCGALYYSSWNTGRSLTFSNTVRNLVRSFDNMLLWDVHRLGTEETLCHSQGTSYTSRNVVNVENQYLYNLICSATHGH